MFDSGNRYNIFEAEAYLDVTPNVPVASMLNIEVRLKCDPNRNNPSYDFSRTLFWYLSLTWVSA